MKKDLTEMVFILDRSGSMGGMESDTIGGYNSMIKKAREGGDAVVTTVLFDDKVEILTDRKDIKDIKDMTKNEYYVRGCTALLDATGKSIKKISKLHKKMNEDERPEKTIFVITTDGLENASREYSYKDVKDLITKKKEKNNWEFIFLGADFDVETEATKLGIGKDRSQRFVKDKSGMNIMYERVGEAICRYQATNVIPEDWAEDINSDFEKRGNK